MRYDWMPQKGELWLTMERWPATGVDPEIPGGALVMCLGGTPHRDVITDTLWWGGLVLHGGHQRWIKVIQGDLIRADDPRLQFERAA